MSQPMHASGIDSLSLLALGGRIKLRALRMIMIHKELATSLFKIRHRCDFTLSHGMTQDQEGYVVHSHLLLQRF